MREIPLTQGQVALIDDEDYELVSRYKWCAVYSPHSKTYYAASAVRDRDTAARTRLMMHAVIMGSKSIDHADHNGLNNQRYNLRFATTSQNTANQRIRSDNTSGFKGVSLDRRNNRWQSYIRINGSRMGLGSYPDPVDAAIAYDYAARELFSEFAFLNFPDSLWDKIEPIPVDYDLIT